MDVCRQIIGETSAAASAPFNIKVTQDALDDVAAAGRGWEAVTLVPDSPCIVQVSRVPAAFFSQLPLSHWVQSMRRVAFSFLNSIASLLISQATTERSTFYFSDSSF